MVEPCGVVRHRLLGGVLAGQIEVDDRIVRRGGQGRRRIERPGERADPGKGNLVIGERQAAVVVRPVLRGVRVVQLLQDTTAVYQATEIAAPHRHGRHFHQLLGALAQRESLEGHEEERTVPSVINLRNPDGAADGAAELIANELRGLKVRRILAGSRDAEVVVARGFEDRAVELVSAGFGGEDDGGGRRKLGARVERLEPHFLNGVRIRQRGLRGVPGAAEIPIRHRSAVLRILHGFPHQAIGARAIGFEAGDRVLREAQHVAPVLRQLLDARGVELCVHRPAIVGGQLNRLAAHADLFVHLANRQLGVENQHLPVLQGDRGFRRLHSRRAVGDRVGTGEKTLQGVESAFVRRGFCRNAGGLVQGSHAGAGEGGGGRILHIPLDGAGAALSP